MGAGCQEADHPAGGPKRSPGVAAHWHPPVGLSPGPVERLGGVGQRPTGLPQVSVTRLPAASSVTGCFVPYAGDLTDALRLTCSKIKATIASCGAEDLAMFRDTARITQVSEQSYLENTAAIRLRDSTDNES